MYRVFKQLADGEFVLVSSREDLEQAVLLVDALHVHWPGNYEIRNSQAGAVLYTRSVGQEHKPEILI
jgi:hypothetical protein